MNCIQPAGIVLLFAWLPASMEETFELGDTVFFPDVIPLFFAQQRFAHTNAWNFFNILPIDTKTGMSELVKERPPNPIEYLASYLIRHDPARAGTVAAKK